MSVIITGYVKHQFLNLEMKVNVHIPFLLLSEKPNNVDTRTPVHFS